jgi:hypothetical protein
MAFYLHIEQARNTGDQCGVSKNVPGESRLLERVVTVRKQI